MHFASAAQAIAAAIVIVAAVASLLAIAKANFAKAQITALRGDRDDQAARIERQDEEIAELQRNLAAEKRAREALEKVVTARDLMEALKTELTAHHEAAMSGQRQIFNTMEQVVEVLEEIKGRAA